MSDFGLCQRRGCPRQATHALSIGVPAAGDPEEMPLRSTMLLDVRLCEAHAEEAEPASFFAMNPALRSLFQALAGRVVLDFERALAMGVPLDGAAFRDLQEIEAAGSAEKLQ